jgi:hypothetical protein
MKTIACASIVALFVITLAAPWSTTAQTPGPFANGSYRFVLEDELTKQLEFDARLSERGTTTGNLTFRDEARILEPDVDGVGDPPHGTPAEFYLQAFLDSLTIEHNRAVMSGSITDSSHQSYIGRWVQLVVEDNGTDPGAPDKFIWRICQVEADGWTPRDAEDPRDEGAWWRWWATDAERREDVGIPSRNIIPDRARRCEVLPLSSYTFDEIRNGDGQIRVQP